MPVYYSEEIEKRNIALGTKLLKAAKLEANLVFVRAALEHAIIMMELSRDRYGDPAKLFDLDYYRDALKETQP